jgi:alpha-beta hydrolase superfamily lysophospholipase
MTSRQPELHVGTHNLLADRSLDFQLDRWIAYGGDSMLADVRSVLDRLATLDGWRSAFLELHERAVAASLPLDAALHLRAAEFFFLPGDPRRPAARRTFVSLMREVFDVVAPSGVPYAGGSLPVYRFAPPRPRHTVVVFGGFDSYIEELFPIFLALRGEGLDVVAFEGPGQGAVLHDARLPMTPDWHLPVSTVLDALGLDDVTLVGISLGGCLAIRAAACEARVRRVVTFDVLADFEACLLAQIPAARRLVLRTLLATRAGSLFDGLVRRDRRPIVEWGVAQGMHVFGVETPHAMLREAARYHTRDVSARVTQDVLLLAGAEDHYVPRRQILDQVAALTGARSITARVFSRAESAHSHCQVGNLPLAVHTIARWIDAIVPAK